MNTGYCGVSRRHTAAAAFLLAMASAGSYGQQAALADETASQLPQARRRKLTKKEKKRAKRAARNLRLATTRPEESK